MKAVQLCVACEAAGQQGSACQGTIELQRQSWGSEVETLLQGCHALTSPCVL